MSVNPYVVEARDVPEWARRVFDPTRFVPLVVVSTSGDTGSPRIDVQQLCSRLSEAEVVVLAGRAAATAWTENVPEHFRAYGGATRVVWPQAGPSDHHRRHSLLRVYPEDDPVEALDRLVRLVEAGEQARPSRPAGMLSAAQADVLSRFRDRLASGAVPSAIQPSPAPPPPPSPVPSPATVPEPDSVNSPSPETEPQGAGEALTPQAAKAMLDKALRRHTDEIKKTMEATLQALLEIVTEVVEDDRRLVEDEGESDWAQDPTPDCGDVPVVFDDPGEQFRWEVEQAWLIGTPQREREVFPMRPWVASQEFLSCLDDDIVPRRKTVEFVIDIVTGRLEERRRPRHPFRTGRGGNDPQRTRSDGALAWRGELKRNSPGAPRITWWELPDRSIELMHVGHHDDLL